MENAFELDPKVTTLRQILAIYEAAGDTEAATATAARVEEQIIRDSEIKKKKVLQEKRRQLSAQAKVKLKTPRRAKGAQKPVAGASEKVSPPKSRIIKSHVGRKRI